MEQAQKQEPEATQDKAGTNGKQSFWQRRPVIVVGTLVLFGLLFLGLGYLAESLTHEVHGRCVPRCQCRFRRA